MPKIEVCLSPALLHLYNTEGANVVIIDIFRATSTIAAALDNGAQYVLPVASVDTCIDLGTQIAHSVTGGERDGKVAPGLQNGNSPLEYTKDFIGGRPLILTTTNGTRLLHMVKGAKNIIIGSFLNIDAVSKFLVEDGADVLLACASWKDRFNLEDTLFAGAVCKKIGDQFSMNCDSVRMARTLHKQSIDVGLLEFLKDSSHYIRLSGFGLEKDMEYCLTPNLHPVLPLLRGDKLVI